MEKGVYKFHIVCGRAGDLFGLFVADKEHIRILLEKEIEVYFGEVLGKHSEIYGSIDESEIELVSDSPEIIGIVEKYNLSIGHNPLDYPTGDFDTVIEYIHSLDPQT